MTLNLTELSSLNYPNTSEKYRNLKFRQKPIEIYVFIDPLCPKCWSLDAYLKKLSIEFGRFFTIRPIISNHLRIIDGNDSLTEHDESVTFFPSVTLAIKAAELQGNNAGRAFLRKIQETFFLKAKNIYDINVLMHCAIEAKLDITEFKRDLYSISAKKAFQSDIKITKEMRVKDTPTIVFFNQVAEDEGVKIVGLNSYDIYLLILKEMLQRDPIPAEKPPLEDFLAYYEFVSNQEVALIFDYSFEEIERTMKRLQLKQKVKKVTENEETYWEYIK